MTDDRRRTTETTGDGGRWRQLVKQHADGLMDKSWMSKSKWSSDYIEGVENFLEFATQSQSSTQKILCPCKLCINRYFHNVKDVKLHLLSKGIFLGYVFWNRHGEEHAFLAEVTRSETCTDTGNVVEVQSQGQKEFEAILVASHCSFAFCNFINCNSFPNQSR
ncbi:hypothetical protein M5K25_001091 [Dendrobium thyrsiflorum]|uniref:Transposase-associated domain-containing protein n=1 Tax=Dendrobium thyrsiflorum TaxID=117978 RepID=A0ABD0VVE5_DENTH